MAQYKNKKKQVHGILLIDKPLGLTSNAALQKVKWLYQAKKAGHTGALDPLATGLLPICFGQATKVSEYLLGSQKKYTTILKLGEVTDTRDAEGEVTERKDVNVTDSEIIEALVQFRGQIKQVPPMFSALKKDGQPLYKLARKGKEVERPARDMTVYSLEFERLSSDLIKLHVHCSSGFYIRSLGHDLGQVLGCGGHIVELRRTDVKSIGVDKAHSLDKLMDMGCDAPQLKDLLLPIDVLISDMPRLEISDQQIDRLLCGQPTEADGLATTELTRFYRRTGQLFALGEVRADGQIKTQKIFVNIDS